MPARTFPTSPDPADYILSPPRFYTRPSPHTASSHPHRDSYDDRFIDSSSYAPSMPAPNARPDPDYASHIGWSPPRIYPDPSTIPPHWQIPPANIPHVRDGRIFGPPGSVLQANRMPWQNPYVRSNAPSFAMPPPPPIPHKVWILDCKSCGTFLTNRGMKAVLLLRPNVPLYSTDALPINCSAYSPELGTPTHTPSTSVSSTATTAGPSHSTRPSAHGTSADAAQASGSTERPLSRTCECLTQTLCCHGCGNAVGYMIVSPCQRCTSSITVNNRATNGHRFVFYSSEITACERHYVNGERGVNPFHPPPPTPVTTQTIQNGLAGLTIGTASIRSSMGQASYPSPPSPSTPGSMPPLSPGPALPGRRTSIDYLPTPPPDADSPFAPSNTRSAPLATAPASTNSPHASISASTSMSMGPALNASPEQLRSRPLDEARQIVPPVPPNSHSASPHTGNVSSFASNTSSETATPLPISPSRARAASTSDAMRFTDNPPARYSYTSHGRTVFFQGPVNAAAIRPGNPPLVPTAQPPAPPPPAPERLKAGEVLYWHHLLRSGEIPAVSEDPRARIGIADADAKGAAGGRRNTIPSGIVCGR